MFGNILTKITSDAYIFKRFVGPNVNSKVGHDLRYGPGAGTS